MDFDILSRLHNEQHVDSSEQLLSNSQHSERLTHEQPADTTIALANGESNNRDIAAIPVDRNQAGAVITKIEDIFESIADCILDDGKELMIPLKSRTRNKNTANQDDSTKANRSLNSEARSITFPNRSPQEAWKFGR
jgi:meiotic recombination protein SPO11